jgi:hypothetical protein
LELLFAAGWLIVDPAVAIYAIALVLLVYLVVGTQNAWNLLLAGRFDVGAWTVSRARPKPSANDGHDSTA